MIRKREGGARRATRPRKYVVVSRRATGVIVRDDCSITTPQSIDDSTEIRYVVDFLTRPLVFGTMLIVLAGAGGGVLAALVAFVATLAWMALSYLRARRTGAERLAERCPSEKILAIAKRAIEACEKGKPGPLDGYRIICPSSREKVYPVYVGVACLVTGVSLLLWILISSVLLLGLSIVAAAACMALLYVSSR